MLLTVQDIPDIGKGSTLTKKPHNHHMNLATNQNQHQPQYQYNTDTVKRSQTSSTISVQDDRRSTTPIIETTNTAKQPSSSSTNNAHAKDLDYYETSSTTTTITPPPSESGRETPLINVNNNPTHQTAREKREITTTTSTSNTSTLQRGGNGSTNREHQQHTRDLAMDLQHNHHQSFVYPQQSRTDFVYATSEDEENIPYHAREDSRPFTYGNPAGVQLSPNGSNSGSGAGTGMLKMQSGLSSPSLVRKTLVRGTSPASTSSVGGRKANVRNDFEEMLMQRREKILNEKYSIGDKTPNGSAQYASSDAKWNSVSSSSNGYHHHEPLKRSNTMDGGFGRSISSDG